MHSRLRSFLENAPIKLIAVILLAILIPSVLVTALGLVAVFQADAFVRDRFTRPLRERADRYRDALVSDWSLFLDAHAANLRDAPARLAELGELRRKDPWVRDVLVSSDGVLELVPGPFPGDLWSPDEATGLSDLDRLELIEGKDEEALAECSRILAGSRDDAVVAGALLAAARISARAGRKPEAESYLRAARERYGQTADATGVVREVPILWRTLEIQREQGLVSRAMETAVELSEALRRHAARMAPEVLRYWEDRLAALEEPLRPPAPLAPRRPPGAPLLTAPALGGLEGRLPGPEAFGARQSVATHCAVEGLGELDFASFRPGSGEIVVHLLLDRERILADALAIASRLGLSPGGLRFVAAGSREGSGADAPVAALPLPSPLDNMRLEYVPAPGELPVGFRGFDVLTVASFTWAVIILVLTIVVGVLFTLRSVLREMRTARMKSDFVSFVSHELKTPLTAIRMFTETVLAGRTENEEEARFCVQMIDQESERLSKLIDQVLEYSRIERRQKEFKFVSCDMEDVVREAVRIFRDHNRLEPREIEMNTAQHISKIRMDRPSMVELILNLLSNAAKYSPRDKKIVVNLRESIDDISVEVVDHGVGIRKRDQKRIFEKFFRADDYLTREVEGTGLGLTFARYIAKVHNGDIKVSSQLHSGSAFTLQLRKTDVLAE